MAIVHFVSNKIKFKLKNQRKISAWIKNIVRQEGSSIQELSYVFCSDAYLLSINKGYLKHDSFTDIITFNYSENPTIIEGEIYISIDRVKENAIKFHTQFEDELSRVIIHGVLHLLGYGDKGTSQKTLMRKKEEACLSLRK
jgi:probable rRNA maturation factor